MFAVSVSLLVWIGYSLQAGSGNPNDKFKDWNRDVVRDLTSKGYRTIDQSPRTPRLSKNSARSSRRYEQMYDVSQKVDPETTVPAEDDEFPCCSNNPKRKMEHIIGGTLGVFCALGIVAGMFYIFETYYRHGPT